jgi:hypothetical protein
MEQASLHDHALGARTQSLFRDVNERVREINATFAEFVPLGDWICECANNGCTQRIELTTREYEEVRGDPAAFAVAPTDDHVFQQIEDVVERKERYRSSRRPVRLPNSPRGSIHGVRDFAAGTVKPCERRSFASASCRRRIGAWRRTELLTGNPGGQARRTVPCPRKELQWSKKHASKP